ncbi:MAG: TIGR04255 family protein [Verrucomicrobiota bacterium]|nr:TIGR04255 family protein [Verrucomicrobiota bacterium]
MAVFKPEKIRREEIPPLLNPPLAEAIFELRWELQSDQQTRRMHDVAYPMMYGRIYERLKKDFPLIEDLPATQVHPDGSPFVVRHRLRKEKNGWPLVQVGPGIVTINEDKSYSWSSFRSLILRVVDSIIELYPSESMPLNFVKSEIRYINGITFDPQKEHPLQYMANKLHLKVEVEPEIFALNEIEERPIGIGMNLAYALNRPVGNFAVSSNLGHVDGKPALILQTVIQSLGETVPQDKENFEMWLSQAHGVAENCFGSLCRGALMQRFSGMDGDV